MSLNSEQQTLYDKIVDQSFSKLLVLGAGGVGKSYLLCKAMSQLARSGMTNMVLCAPTHLARLNIHSKLDSDVSHLIETSTVASLLLKFGIYQDDGTTQFTAGKIDKIDKYSVIALDECSMISESDYMLFMTSKAKIIFLGDWAQLPPVMAKSAEKKVKSHTGTGNIEVFELTQQMRQQGVIHAAAERNRKAVWFPTESQTGAAGESIIVHQTEPDMVNSMIRNILSDPRKYDSTHHHRYIAYKNKQVRKVGKTIRDKVLQTYFGFNAQSVPFIAHELIMMRENKSSIGYNGELVEIQNARLNTNSGKYPWRTYDLMVKGSLGTGMIRSIPPCEYELLDNYVAALQSKLRKYQIAGQQSDERIVLSEIKRIRSHWTPTQYPYAVTTHKSQGSTLENVYLNTLSFAQAPNRRALLYVGISRASQSLHTVHVPPNLQLRQSEVNAEYRKARAAYEDLTGESYQKVLRYLRIPTGTLEGKVIATEYIRARISDLEQADE